MMRDRLPHAIVVGLDSVTGLQTARLLAHRGIPVIGVATDVSHPACRTRRCERIVQAPAAGDALVDVLASLAGRVATPPVLLPCTDLSVMTASRHRDTLREWYRCVLPRPGVIETLLDKASFHEHAVREGLPVASTSILRSRSDAERAASTLTYPCIIKPAVKGLAWQQHTSAKVIRADSARQLLTIYDQCQAWADVLLAQEWIDGPDTSHVTCNAYFDAGGRVVASYVSRKLRQWPLHGGVGCLSEGCRNDEVAAHTERVFHSVGHHGLAYLEMKYDRVRGAHVIIEPNVGRPTGRSAAADAAGIPLVYTAYCDALGWPLPPVAAQADDGRKWIYLRQDAQAAFAQWRQGNLGPVAWLRSLRGCRSDALLSLGDAGPFLADIAKGVSKGVTRATASSPAHRPHAAAAPPVAPGTVSITPVDFDVHGVAGIRLIDASADDVAVVARQIGPLRGLLTRDPDIVIRFVDHLDATGLRFIEYGRTGFTDDAFFVLQSGKRETRVRVDIDEVGRRVTYTCQRGLRAVPMLLAFVNLVALNADCVALHASAFVHRDTGVLVTGWAKGGKTEALLAFAAEGAEYVGDEWILLRRDGQAMYGIPEHIRLQDWHIRQLPHLWSEVPRSRRLLFTGIRTVDGAHRALASSRLGRRLPLSWLRETLPALRRQLNVQLNPARVFGPGTRAFEARPSAVFFMLSHDDPRILVDPIDTDEIAQRMTASISVEMAPLMGMYHAYRFAFPNRHGRWMDEAAGLRLDILSTALRGKRAFAVRHPYPCVLRDLFRAMAPLCTTPSSPLADLASTSCCTQGVSDAGAA